MTQAARLFHINRRLHEGFSVTAASLEHELEVSRATIYRDIAVLRNQLNAPIAWDAEAKTYRLADGGQRFVLPGLWLGAEELYGLLTVINVAGAIDPGVTMPYQGRFRSLMKQLAAEHHIEMYGIHEKVTVALPKPPDAAKSALRVIGPALMLDIPVYVTIDQADGKAEHLVVPTRLDLRADGWWLRYTIGVQGPSAEVPVLRITDARRYSAQKRRAGVASVA